MQYNYIINNQFAYVPANGPTFFTRDSIIEPINVEKGTYYVYNTDRIVQLAHNVVKQTIQYTPAERVTLCDIASAYNAIYKVNVNVHNPDVIHTSAVCNIIVNGQSYVHQLGNIVNGFTVFEGKLYNQKGCTIEFTANVPATVSIEVTCDKIL